MEWESIIHLITQLAPAIEIAFALHATSEQAISLDFDNSNWNSLKWTVDVWNDYSVGYLNGYWSIKFWLSSFEYPIRFLELFFDCC